MKIAFLKPPIGGILGLEMITFVEPLGLECVAGGLVAEGHDCRIIDMRIEGEQQGLAKCRTFEPDIVGLQCNFTTERYRTLRLARRVKQELPDTFVIVGGHDAARQPEWFQDAAIDAVAVGDGEDIMSAVIAILDSNKNLSAAPGLMIRTASGLQPTQPAPPVR
jgi:radical SAM superfamily enzyme YgiQ (UPF0313 family)